MNHSLRMMLGCLLPWTLIFILPLFGIDQGLTFLIFLGLMFACHLLMLGGHHRSPQPDEDFGASKGGKHE